MNETNTATTAEAAAQAPAPEAQAGEKAAAPETVTPPAPNFNDNPWSRLAREANKDLFVQVRDPQFDAQTKRVKFLEPEMVAATDAGHGTAVKISYIVEEEIITTTGDKKAPGFKITDRFAKVLVPGDASQADRVERDGRDIVRILQAAGLLPKRVDRVPQADIYAGLAALGGRQAEAAFKVEDGKKRDAETGELMKFQRVHFAPVGSSNGANQAAAAFGGVPASGPGSKPGFLTGF